MGNKLFGPQFHYLHSLFIIQWQFWVGPFGNIAQRGNFNAFFKSPTCWKLDIFDTRRLTIKFPSYFIIISQQLKLLLALLSAFFSDSIYFYLGVNLVVTLCLLVLILTMVGLITYLKECKSLIFFLTSGVFFFVETGQYRRGFLEWIDNETSQSCKNRWESCHDKLFFYFFARILISKFRKR